MPTSNSSLDAEEVKRDDSASLKSLSDEKTADVDAVPKLDRFARKVTGWITQHGLEGHGIEPVPLEQRTDPRLYQIFFVWFTANMNVLSLGAGSVAPAVFGLGIRDSLITITVVDVIACAFPAFFAVFGPKLGTRAMVQSRFSWGYYGAIIPSILNVLSMQGYVIINCIIGGQTLAAVSSHLDPTLGIVITGLISLAVTFCGYRVLHWYESLAWIPNVVAFVVMVGVSGKTLVTEVPVAPSAPATAASILSFVATLGTFVVSWSTITPDYGIFHDAKASSYKIFAYAYLGFLISSIPVHFMGAAFTAGAAVVPAWNDAFGGNDVGALMAAALAPVGGFGKFLVVLMALTTPSAIAPSMYAVCTSFMTIAPVFSRVPRCIFALISTAILIPVCIVGASHFYDTFEQILSFIGYWIAPFVAIVIVEHFVFRRGTWSRYDVENAWNRPGHPRGYAALFTFVTSIGLIVLCMSQSEWTGPIARRGTGDIAMLVSFAYAVVVYLPARWFEGRCTSTSTSVRLG